MFKESGSENSSVAETTLISPTIPSSPTTSTCCGMELLPANASDVQSLDEARKIIRDLRQRYRAQAQQLLAWRRSHKIQEDLVCRLQREKAEQLKCLSSKLILFESRLIRKQKDISSLLNHREMIILRQQRIIDVLTNRLIENGLDTSTPSIGSGSNTDYLIDLDGNNLQHDLESLNDSDSAVIMEDMDSDSAFYQLIPRYQQRATGNAVDSVGLVTVCRSISDAIDTSIKYSSSSTRRCNGGFLRRPEILETVYSVEEDGEADNTDNQSKSPPPPTPTTPNASLKRETFASIRSEKIQMDTMTSEKNCCYDEFTARVLEKRSKSEHNSPEEWSHQTSTSCNDIVKTSNTSSSNRNQVTTYNRVMSNHRSVTKPKDVKYKRINKAKSKSLEELRGRLRNWVEHGNKLAGLSVDQTHSYA